MRKVFILLFFFINYGAYSQAKALKQKEDVNTRCHCRILPPRAVILGMHAKERFKRYEDKRKSSKQPDIDVQIRYPALGLLHLFQKVMANTEGKQKYDGLRIYFANYPDLKADKDSGIAYVPKNKAGKMALIFVPTMGDADTYHGDDLSSCWTIDPKDGKEFITIDPKIAGKWVRRAEQRYLATFEIDGKVVTGNADYLETHSLWYTTGLLKDGGLGLGGLIQFLNCRICKDSIDGVIFHMGAFQKNNKEGNDYKLTLIFGYHDKGIKTAYLFPYEGNIAVSTGYTDTGKPCPPPTSCSGTGAILPNQ